MKNKKTTIKKLFKYTFLCLLNTIFNGNVQAQLYSFSTSSSKTCDSWDALVDIPVTVSGLSSPLTPSCLVLREVRVQLGNKTCKKPLDNYQIKLSNPGGSKSIYIAGNNSGNGILKSTTPVWINSKFRDHPALERLNEYKEVVQGTYFPHAIGYYAIDKDGDYSIFNGSDPNGNWTFTITESSSLQGISIEKLELIFGNPISLNDLTGSSTNNSCNNSECISNGVIIGTNKGYSDNDPLYPDVTGCFWNANNNNSAWFNFRPTSPSVKITISGLKSETLTSDVSDVQSIILRANGCSARPNVVPSGGCPLDPVNNTSYLISNGGGVAAPYSNGITDNCEFNLSGLNTTTGAYYLYVDGYAGVGADFYIDIEEGVGNSCACVISGPAIVCAGSSPVQYTVSSTALCGSSWSLSNPLAGTISSIGEFTPAASLTSPLNTQIIYADGACNVTRNITVNIPPTLTLTNNALSVCKSTIAQTASLPFTNLTGAPDKYTIDYDGAATAAGFADRNDFTFPAGNNFSISIPPTVAPGLYNANLIIKKTSTGCERIYPFTITIRPKPSLNDKTINACSEIPFSFTPTDVVDGVVPVGTKYSWLAPAILPASSVTGGSVASDQVVIGQTLKKITTTTSPATAIYTVTASVGAAGNLCSSAPFKVTVSVRNTAIPTFNTYGPFCEGAILPAPILPTNSNNGISGIWNPASLSANTPGDIVYNFTPNPITPSGTGCAFPYTMTVKVKEGLTANIRCGIQNNNSIEFLWDLVTGATGYNLSYVKAGTPFNDPSGNSPFSVSGLNPNDQIKMTVLPQGPPGNCFKESNVTCIANAACPPLSAGNLSGPSTVCIDASPSFTSDIVGGKWETSDITVATIDANNGQLTSVKSGTVTLRYTVSSPSPGCPNVSQSITTTIQPKPIIAQQPVGYDKCVGDPFTSISLNATGSGLNYQWYKNSVNSAIGGTIITGETSDTYTPSSEGFYYAIVNGSCGSGTSSVTTDVVQVKNLPNISITGQPSGYKICEGGSATPLVLTAGGAGSLSYQWYSNTTNNNTGGTSIPLANDFDYQPLSATPATTYYYAKVTDACGTTVSNTAEIIVSPKPSVNIQYGAVCLGASNVSLAFNTVTGAPDKYSIEFDNNALLEGFVNINDNLPSVSPISVTVPPAAQSGIYDANLKVLISAINGCESASYPIQITINEKPEVRINNLSLCSGVSDNIIATPLSGLPPDYTFDWVVPSSVTTPTNDVFSFPTGITGDYKVTITDKITGCISNQVTGIVTSNPGTAISFISFPANEVCMNSDVVYSTQTGQKDYVWSVPGTINTDYKIISGGLGLTDPAVTLQWLTPGNKTVTINYTDNSGCKGQSPAQSNINVKPDETPIFDLIPPVCINSSNPPELKTESNNNIKGTWEPSVVSTQFTNTYKFIPDAGQCATTTTLKVTVALNPVVDAGPPRIDILEGESVTLNGVVSGTNDYAWTPDQNISDVRVQNPVVNPSDDITYKLTATTSDGCEAEDEVLILVLKELIIPNIFSPNGDGINDRFEIENIEKYKDATVDIFNRYGQQLIRFVGGYTNPWDGKVNGKDVPAGTYFYVITPNAGKRKVISGSISIVR